MKRLIFVLVAFVVVSCATVPESYFTSDGLIQGTTYHIVYKNKSDLGQDINLALHRFDTSLSAYISESTISKINNNQIDSTNDTLFLSCLRRSLEISELTHGAMDITVSPLVNVWGFGFSKREHVTQHLIDSLREFCSYTKIHLNGNRITKDDPRIQLNANCIAQGQSVDFIAEMFEGMGIYDYMVEIGGEVRANGVNARNSLWRIGIDKPIDDSTSQNREIQSIVEIDNRSISTSGNYRKFYVEDGMKYSHTIDPATGYPAQSSLLSASIVGPDCITTDALATACMVLGAERASQMCDTLPGIDYYLIYADSVGNLQTLLSKGFEDIILK